MKTKRQILRILLLIAGGMALSASGVNFPLGTYVYTGSVMNYRNEVCSSADHLSIQAVSTNGTVLAVSDVVDPDTEGVNFRLEVPVATSATDKSAAIGDAPRCVVVSPRGIRGAATETFPTILCASAVTNCVVVWSAAVSFTDKSGGETVFVPADYIDGISYLMAFQGKTDYDPFADWDGDGFSNYAEYVAGTNPFDASDLLRITAFSASPEAAVVSFEYVGGHLYGLKAARSLSNPDWATVKFGTDGQSARQKTLYGGDEEVGIATLYVTPVADEPQKFFKVEAK